MTIEWPTYNDYIPIDCQAEPKTTISFIGANQLGEQWREIDLINNQMLIRTDD